MTNNEYRFLSEMLALMSKYDVRLVAIPSTDDATGETRAFVGKDIYLDLPTLTTETQWLLIPPMQS